MQKKETIETIEIFFSSSDYVLKCWLLILIENKSFQTQILLE